MAELQPQTIVSHDSSDVRIESINGLFEDQEPSRDRSMSLDRILFAITCGLIMLLPFFMGGKSRTEFFVAQTLLSLVGVSIFGEALLRGYLTRNSPSLFQAAIVKKLLSLMMLAFGLIAIQLLPLPLTFLGLLSDSIAEGYRVTGQTFGSISVERSLTNESLIWLCSLSILGILILKQPISYVSIGGTNDRRSQAISRDFQEFLRRSSRIDCTVGIISDVIILTGFLCGIVAILHWALRVDYYFGIWNGGREGIETARAHWPFVNPDHLSVYLEISAILACAKLLRRVEIQQLRSVALGEFRLRDRISQEEQRAISKLLLNGVVVFIIVVATFLSASKAGMALTLLAIMVLWSFHRRLQQRFVHHRVGSGRHTRKRVASHWRRFLIRYLDPLSFVALIGVLVIVLGSFGREIVASRIEYGLVRGYDTVRAVLSSITLNVILSSPIFGVGLGCWEIFVTRFSSPLLAGWTLDYAHNDSLQLISEVGVIGFLPWLIGGIIALRAAVVVAKTAKDPGTALQCIGLFLAVFVPVIHSLVDFPFHIPGVAVAYVAIAFAFLRFIALEQLSDTPPKVI